MSAADRRQGRFRSWLLTSLKNFLANEWDHSSAQKRGGGVAVVSIDAQDADCLLTSYAVSTRPVIAARVERSAKVQRLPCLQAAVDGADICDYICAMAQLALYVEDDLLKRLDRAAKQAGVSRSRFVARVLAQQLEERLPETFFEVLGSWEDERSPTQIIRDLRRAPRDRRVRVK